jgi:hypothetical protein
VTHPLDGPPVRRAPKSALRTAGGRMHDLPPDDNATAGSGTADSPRLPVSRSSRPRRGSPGGCPRDLRVGRGIELRGPRPVPAGVPAGGPQEQHEQCGTPADRQCGRRRTGSRPRGRPGRFPPTGATKTAHGSPARPPGSTPTPRTYTSAAASTARPRPDPIRPTSDTDRTKAGTRITDYGPDGHDAVPLVRSAPPGS